MGSGRDADGAPSQADIPTISARIATNLTAAPSFGRTQLLGSGKEDTPRPPDGLAT